MNNLSSLYHNKTQLDSLAIPCLQATNFFDPIPSIEINYLNKNNQIDNQGNYGALKNAIIAGINKHELNTEMILEWRNLLLEELKKYGASLNETELDVNKIQEMITKINQNIEICNLNPKETEIVSLIGDTLVKSEIENLFFPVTRRINFLIMNYIRSYFREPIIVFKPEEVENYQSASDNQLKMKILLANKVRETVFYDGSILFRVGGNYGTEQYRAPESPNRIDLAIEWHELLIQVRKWKEEIES